MSADDSDQRRNVRLFVGAHLLAVMALFGLAVAAGGGVASTPMPPSELVVAHAVSLPAMPVAAFTHATRTESADAPGPVLERQEVAPPWSIDANGRARLHDR
jgi:hypothetical protein